MPINYIKRITGSANSIVEIETTDTTTTATTAGYLTTQSPVIASINDGTWTWEPGDCVLLNASDGLSWCSLNATFTTLTILAPNGPGTNSVTYSGVLTTGHLPIFNGSGGVVIDSGILGTNVVSKAASNQLAAAANILLDKSAGTATGNAVTINKQSGVVTSIALTTASGANATPIVITNSQVTTSSVVLCQIQGGTNTTNGVTILAVPGTGNITVTLTNGNVSGAALNGTVVFSFCIF
jgi:hypothetical protein